MNKIQNRASESKRRHALTLPNSTASDVLGDASALPAYYALSRRFREWLGTENVRARLAHQKAETEYSALRPLVVADAIRLNLGADFDFDRHPREEEARGRLKRYLALNIALDREDARIGAIDEALAGSPVCAFMQFIGAHNDDDLMLHDAMVAEMLGEPDELVQTVESLADKFEEALVELVDHAKDRLAVVTRTISHHQPPSFTDDEKDLAPIIRAHWEREHSELYHQLCGEKKVWEELLATPDLESAYFWARGVDSCIYSDVVKPSISLVLEQWQRDGIAGPEITVDAIFEELFKES
ncbi:hypothetical protein IAD21_01220 [Abditibacteriota bacterium]|nr:hypothetical protein IAD21_01220 [Abditibacteriota bacterium]